ncbi:MAG: NAD(P)-dependent glycerol-3-phosphate dehydrogenase [Armatimonadetes bacterium]|nr:NAD(P)-dependent glycerol-3-phosphate dehydrogenase [Armatimonadota bacterium]
MNERIAILGAGSWGTALALLFGTTGRAVTLWARDTALVGSIRTARVNTRYLPNFPLPPTVALSADIAETVASADTLIWAVPSGAFREVTQQVVPYLAPTTLLVSATKGLEEGTCLRMSQVLTEIIPEASERTVVLSGPNLALEMARGVPTAGVVASANLEAARRVQSLVSGLPEPTFRLYTGQDVVGVELGGAVKNVIAIGAGICDGLGFGDNSKAGLVTRGLAETMRLGIALGAETATFLGLSGVGDLFATTNSRLSRNYRVGLGLGQGKRLPDILHELGQVAEGVPTTHVVCALSQRCGIEMPLCQALYSVLFENRDAPQVIRELMLRPPKGEYS